MHRVGRWLDRGRLSKSSSSQSLDSLAESQNLESALRAVELIMNDDLEGAEKGLSTGNSAFHQLCRGVIGFMKATLGFEQDIMKEASAQLSAAENSAYNDNYKAQRNASYHSSIYDRGSEFALCQAMAQIMAAVVGVLNESLTESLKGFYKLRKAYMTLEGLMQMENAAMKARGVRSLASSRQASPDGARSMMSTSETHLPRQANTMIASAEAAHAKHPSGLRQTENMNDEKENDSEGSDEFYDIDNAHPETESYTGRLNVERRVDTPVQEPEPSESATEKLAALSVSDTQPDSSNSNFDKPANSCELLTADPDDPIFDNSLDVFIHSGTNLCFGLISLLISMIPPAFTKLLYIIGFRGDRERGMRMLWQASKFPNICGAMAGLIILGWYNGLVGFCDIIPDNDPRDPLGIDGYPSARLNVLLNEMRKRYPESHFWLIEEARLACSSRDLNKALTLLSQPSGKSQLKQLQALHMFEKSINSMDAHRYQLCADSFIACVDLNSWSQALYYYIAAAAHLTSFRNKKGSPGNESEAQNHRKLAEEYFRTAPTKTGKKKMMGRQLPFDTFVNRKIAKWTARAEAWQCDLIDAVGVSPLEEMILLWNGHKKMSREQLEVSLHNLAWSESAANTFWGREDLDEKAILALLRAVVYRNLRQHETAQRVLKEQILCHEPQAFKGANRDDWTAPTAHYEYAVNLWMQRSGYVLQNGRGLVDPQNTASKSLSPVELDLDTDRNLVREAKTYIEKAKAWDKYELDARIGMKVTAAADAVKKWEARYPVTSSSGR